MFLLEAWSRSRRFRQANYQYPWHGLWGSIRTPIAPNSIWIHALSLGEVRSIKPLVQHISKHHPQQSVVITCTAIGGYVEAMSLESDNVSVLILPLDYAWTMRRFIRALKPQRLLIVETEIWPVLLHQCWQHSVPVWMVNVRMKQQSFRRYKCFRALFAPSLQRVAAFYPQSQQDRTRLQQLGVDSQNIKAAGNLKFDMPEMPELLEEGSQWCNQYSAGRFVWTAGSVHDGEQSILGMAHRYLAQKVDKPLLFCVPRQLDSAFGLVGDLKSQGLTVVLLSEVGDWQQLGEVVSTIDVVVVDAYGVLLRCYAMAHVAFVGGSLIPFGGHNIIEPAAFGKPVLSGRNYANLQALFEQAITEDALHIVHDEIALSQELIRLATNSTYYAQRSGRAYTFQQGYSGTLKTLLHDLDKTLSPIIV